MKVLLFVLSLFIASSIHAQISDFESVDFTVADNIAKLHEGRDLNNLALLAHDLTYKLDSDVEKFRAIYTWVCNNIEGDANQDNKVIKKRKEFVNDSLGYLKWNNQFKKTVFKTLLRHKRTMCTGYAYLIKELCFLANIECQIIDGYGRTSSTNVERLELKNHSWNAVKLNGKWYLCDATWSSGYTNEKNNFVSEYNEGYFLAEPVLFSKSHYPLHKKWLLNDSLIQRGFKPAPVVYGETFKHKVIPIYPRELRLTATRNTEVTFSMKSLKDIDIERISMMQYQGITEEPFDIYDIENNDGLITFKYKFKFKKAYDVHLKIDDDIVASYTIKVIDEDDNSM